jgi:hypothetical protein
MRRLVVIAIVASWPAPANAGYMKSAAPAEPRPLTVQQQKLRTCGAEWQAMKAGGTTGETTWAQYRRDCLRRK